MTQETAQAQAVVRGGASAEATRSSGSGGGAVGGSTQIADSVVSHIAGLAAREVSGVHDMAASGAGSTFASFTGRSQPDKGVTVEVGQSECIVDLSIVVEFGANIPQVCEALRRNVATRLSAMTGLTAKEVNISVSDLFVPTQN